MDGPLVSVIVPVYNSEKYVECCVRSVMNQVYGNLQIILVDDGAKDSSGMICDQLAQEDQRICVIHKENGGLSSARNAGIAKADGEYISLVDSDDYVNPRFISDLLQACLTYGSKLSICNYQEVFGNVVISDTLTMGCEIVSQEQLFQDLFSERNVETVISCNKLYHSDLKPQLKYPVGRQNEDEAIIHELIDAIPFAVRVNKKLYYYRQTQESITRKKYNLKMLDELTAKEERLSYFRDHRKFELFQLQLYAYCSRMIYHYGQLAKLRQPADKCKLARDEILQKYCNAYKQLHKNTQPVKKRIRLLGFYLLAILKPRKKERQ